MNVLLHISRALVATLVVLGMQLPCPCPADAMPDHSSQQNSSQQNEHSCCPDDAQASKKDRPQNDEGHVCSHCSDDLFTKAHSLNAPEKASLSLPPVLLHASYIAQPIWVQDGIEHTLHESPPPLPTRAIPRGRTIRIQQASYLC